MTTHWLVKKTTDGTVVSPAKVKLMKLNIGTKPVPKKVGGQVGAVKPGLPRKPSSASLPKIESKNSSSNLTAKAAPEANGVPKLPPINGAA